MADQARLQIRTNLSPEAWSDVGPGTAGVPLPVEVESSALPSGAATSVKQDSQIALETTLNSLTETLQELTIRLTAIAATVANTQQLRVVQASVPSTAVTGPITSAQSIAEKNIAGVMYTTRVATENLNAINSNVNNVEVV